ncbi:flagellar basal body P-ring protein FlgI [Vampirovibrio sp.]|uniref:flagellar basal body P-ring protein FlgI n=1 Tax=Vampirovibrio sp. TaxID=2717857 RepID=UPI003593DA05
MCGFNAKSKKTIALGLIVTGLLASVLPGLPAHAATLRIKDIAHVKGVRNNQLVGYGLVVGLSKTGDKSRSTQTSTANLINNFNGRLNNDNDIRSTNTAAVIITAIVPPFAKEGDPLDVMVSSMADASSLEGGVLVNSELRAPNGEVVALAQGPLSTGGTSVDASGSSKRTAITTSARIPNGAIMEREIHTQIGDEYGMDLVLGRTDFTLASRVAESITKNVAPARAIDGSTVRVLFPDQFIDNRVAFLSKVENVTVNATEEVAKVVINERTGTIVIGSNVKLLPAAVAHGGITVSVETANTVSQPGSFTQGGQTVGVSNSKISIDKAAGSLVKLGANATLQDLVAALNALGVTPSDLISVLQALKAAGSLEATLEII